MRRHQYFKLPFSLNKDEYINFGVRQGSVLSPVLFVVYLDDFGKLCSSRYIILYADDILLISPSVTYT